MDNTPTGSHQKIRTALVVRCTSTADAVRETLTAHGAFEIVADALSGCEAVAMLSRVCPELLVLDVEAPHIGALSRATALGLSPATILLVRSNEAAHAVEDGPFIVVMSPSLSTEEIHRCLTKAQTHLRSGLLGRLSDVLPVLRRRPRFRRSRRPVRFMSKGKLMLLDPAVIECIDGVGTTRIHTSAAVYAVDSSFRRLAQTVDMRFRRIGPRTLFNVDAVAAIQMTAGYCPMVRSHSGREWGITNAKFVMSFVAACTRAKVARLSSTPCLPAPCQVIYSPSLSDSSVSPSPDTDVQVPALEAEPCELIS